MDRSITHNQICLQTKDLIQQACQIPSPVILEEANLMQDGASQELQNHRSDVNTIINGNNYVFDISLCSELVRPNRNEIAPMHASVKARELQKKRKYAQLRSEFSFLPLVFGTNGYISSSSSKFFQILANKVDSLGRIPVWYFWQSLVPEFLTTIDRGIFQQHQDFFRKLAHKRNPQRNRLIDNTTRLAAPSSAARRFL